MKESDDTFLQGLLIFVILVCKKNIFDSLKIVYSYYLTRWNGDDEGLELKSFYISQRSGVSQN